MVRILREGKSECEEIVLQSSHISAFTEIEVQVSLNCEVVDTFNYTLGESIIQQAGFVYDMPYLPTAIKVLDLTTGELAYPDLLSIEAWGAMDGRSYTGMTLTQGSYPDGSFRIEVIDPVGWVLLGVVYKGLSATDACFFAPMEYINSEGYIIGYNSLIITPEVFDAEVIPDGIVTIRVTTNEVKSISLLIDCELRCEILEHYVNNPESNLYMLYDTIRNSTNCDQGSCKDLCRLYSTLREGLDTETNKPCTCKKKKTQVNCGCK